MERVDAVVIGAGVVGLAVARALAMAGREVLVLEAAGQFRVFPWDRDFSFTFKDSSLERGLGSNIIFTRAYAQPDLRPMYFDTAEAAARLMAEENWLETEIDRVLAIIDTAVREDTRKQFSNDLFDSDIVFLREFARERPAFLIDEIARLR